MELLPLHFGGAAAQVEGFRLPEIARQTGFDGFDPETRDPDGPRNAELGIEHATPAGNQRGDSSDAWPRNGVLQIQARHPRLDRRNLNARLREPLSARVPPVRR